MAAIGVRRAQYANQRNHFLKNRGYVKSTSAQITAAFASATITAALPMSFARLASA